MGYGGEVRWKHTSDLIYSWTGVGVVGLGRDKLCLRIPADTLNDAANCTSFADFLGDGGRWKTNLPLLDGLKDVREGGGLESQAGEDGSNVLHLVGEDQGSLAR